MRPFAVVGMGPGGPDYLLPVARRAIEEADFLMGAVRHLAQFPDKPGLALSGSVEAFLDRLAEAATDCRVALLVSGDPGFHSLLGAVRRRFPRGAYEIFPGLSAFQLAAARLGMPWEDAVLVSVHGGDLCALDRIEKERPAMILLGGNNDAAAVAKRLAGRFGPGRPCAAAIDLGLSSERLVETSLGAMALGGCDLGGTALGNNAARKIGGLCVLVLL